MEVLDFETLKTDLHGALLSRIDLEKLSAVDDAKARRAVAAMIQEIVGAQKVPLNAAEKERVEIDLLDEVFGLGPLEPLLKDPAISDILVNNRNVVYVERRGILETDRREVPGRPAPDAGDRSHRVAGGPPGGRILAHGGCQASGRLASERHHSAPGPGRSLHVHSALRQRARRGGSSGEAEKHFRRDDADSGGRGESQNQHPDLGRHGSGQDYLHEHPLQLHSGDRADRHHRRRRRVAAQTRGRGAARNQASQCGGHWAPCARDSF